MVLIRICMAFMNNSLQTNFKEQNSAQNEYLFILKEQQVARTKKKKKRNSFVGEVSRNKTDSFH